MEDGKHEKKSNQRMLSAALIAGTLAGCGSDNSDSTESTAVESTAGDSTESADSSDGETEGNSKYKDFITVDVFDSMANLSGNPVWLVCKNRKRQIQYGTEYYCTERSRRR